MVAGNSSFDTFVSSTIRKYRKTLVNNLIGQQALWWQLGQRGLLTEEKGGRSIVVPIMYGDNDTVSSYRGYDVLNNDPQDGITSVEYVWKYVAGSVSISGQEMVENFGTEQIFNLLEGKIKQTEVSLKKDLNVQTHGDGTGNSSKDLTGLDAAVEDGASWGTYGGVDRSDSDNTWWRNQWFSFDTQYGASSTFDEAEGNSTKGITAMRHMFSLCDQDHSQTTLILTTRDLLEAYEAEIEGAKQRVVDRAMADAGFTNLTFKGVPIVADSDCPTEDMIFLNSENIKLVAVRGRNFHSTPFQQPINQDAKVSQILFAGNLVTDRSDRQGRITAFTPFPA